MWMHKSKNGHEWISGVCKYGGKKVQYVVTKQS
jgi:hypothetical protein